MDKNETWMEPSFLEHISMVWDGAIIEEYYLIPPCKEKAFQVAIEAARTAIADGLNEGLPVSWDEVFQRRLKDLDIPFKMLACNDTHIIIGKGNEKE